MCDRASCASRRFSLPKRRCRHVLVWHTRSAVIMVSNIVQEILDVLTRATAFPDKGYFGHIANSTKTPLRAIWFTVLLAILPGLLDLASPIAANAIFALTAIALDMSYIIPIFL